MRFTDYLSLFKIEGVEIVASVLLDNGLLRVRRTIHGLVMYPVNDQFIGRSLDLYGEWSADDSGLVAPFIQPGGTVLDLGANIGTFALSIAQAVGPKGRVIAFEPVAVSYRLLNANLVLNDAVQVEARREAIGAKTGQTTVPVLDLSHCGNYGASAITPDGTGDIVPVIAIDDLDLSACDLLKADVEGHENEVLKGAERTIRRFRPALFLENEEPELSRSLIETLFGLDYRLWWHSPSLFRPSNWFGSSKNVFPTFGSLNIFALPSETSLEAPTGLVPVIGALDWPSWWPDWSRQKGNGLPSSPALKAGRT